MKHHIVLEDQDGQWSAHCLRCNATVSAPTQALAIERARSHERLEESHMDNSNSTKRTLSPWLTGVAIVASLATGRVAFALALAVVAAALMVARKRMPAEVK